jgi:PKD repeat protein
MINEKGISGVVATIFLVSIFALTAAIFVALVVNQTPSGPVPEVNFDVAVSEGDIRIYHQGGESLEKSEIRIFVNGNDETDNFSLDGKHPGDWPWSIGEVLNLTVPSVTPEVRIIYTGGSRTDLLYGTTLNATTPAPTASSSPTAKFSANVTGGTIPLTVQFTDTSTQFPEAWLWDFGDSNKSTVQNPPAYTYTTKGTYTVKLTVNNSYGSSSTQKTITVKEPVVASFESNVTGGVAPLAVQFTDTSLGTPINYFWEFGDGNTSPNRNPVHIYWLPGTYTVNLTAGHEYDSAKATGSITVVSQAPTVTGIVPNQSTTGTTVVITNLTGANFQSGAAVVLNRLGSTNITATDVTVVSPTQIMCSFDLTGASAGQWNVIVTNPDGKSGSLPNGFTILDPAPTVTSITPNSGGRGTTVEITALTGTGFKGGTTVKLTRDGKTDVNADNVIVVNSTTITCSLILPGGGGDKGDWNVVVTNPDGQFGTLINGFTITNN